MFQEYTVEAIR